MRSIFLLLFSSVLLFQSSVAQLDSTQIQDYYRQYHVTLFTDQLLFDETTLRSALVSYDLQKKSFYLNIFQKDQLVYQQTFNIAPVIIFFDARGNLFFMHDRILYRMDTKQTIQPIGKAGVWMQNTRYMIYRLPDDPHSLYMIDKVTGNTEKITADRIGMQPSINKLWYTRADTMWIMENELWCKVQLPPMSDQTEMEYFQGELLCYDKTNGTLYQIDYHRAQVHAYASPYLNTRKQTIPAASALKARLTTMSDATFVYAIAEPPETFYNEQGYHEYDGLTNHELNHLINLPQEVYRHLEVYNMADSSLVVLVDSAQPLRFEYRILNNETQSLYWIELRDQANAFPLDFHTPHTWLYNTRYRQKILLDSLLPGLQDYFASPDGEYIFLINTSDSIYRYRMRDQQYISLAADVKQIRGWSRFQYNPYQFELNAAHYDPQQRVVLFNAKNDLIRIDSAFNVQIMNDGLEKRAGLVYRFFSVNPQGETAILSYDYNSGISGMYITRRNKTETLYQNEGYHYVNHSINNHDILFNEHILKEKRFVAGNRYVVYYESYNNTGEAYIVQERGKKKRQFRISLPSDKPFPAMHTRHISVPAEEDMVNSVIYYPPNFDSTKQYPVIMQTYLRNSLFRNAIVHPMWRYAMSEFSYRNITYDGYIMVDVDAPLISGDFYRQPNPLNIINRHLRTLAYIDSNAIALTGHSMGAAIGMGALTEDSLFRCAVLFAGVNFYMQFYTGQIVQATAGNVRLTPYGYRYQRTRNDSTLYEILHPEQMIEKDPFFNLEKINTSILLIHNKQDIASLFNATAWFYIRSQLLRKDIRLIEFKDQNHTLQPKYYKALQELLRGYFKKLLRIRAD